jgi:hypothetical protein
MKWVCDRCQADLTDYSQVGYDGPADREDTGCNPFMAWETLCLACEADHDAEAQGSPTRSPETP